MRTKAQLAKQILKHSTYPNNALQCLKDILGDGLRFMMVHKDTDGLFQHGIRHTTEQTNYGLFVFSDGSCLLEGYGASKANKDESHQATNKNPLDGCPGCLKELKIDDLLEPLDIYCQECTTLLTDKIRK